MQPTKFKIKSDRLNNKATLRGLLNSSMTILANMGTPPPFPSSRQLIADAATTAAAA